MKSAFSILSLILLSVTAASAQQNDYYIVRLSDKNGSGFSLSNPSAYLSDRAIERRRRQKILPDSSDLPVSRAYLDSIRHAGDLDIHTVLKWQNEVCIRTADEDALEKIRQFPFVKMVYSIRRQQHVQAQGSISGSSAACLVNVSGNANSSRNLDASRSLTAWGNLVDPGSLVTAGNLMDGGTATENKQGTELAYGSSFDQIHIHQGDYLHDQGFRGQGMLIAVLDAGFFHYKTNPAFDSLRLQNRIRAEWDFVMAEESVNEDHAHGMICLSMMAANLPGVLVGSAPAASYLLLRTEDANSEMPVEEYNWAAAAEYADSAGADIISSSLGYVNFDDPTYNHTYSQRDGKTTVITRAANKAATKGILVMSSAGNDGAATTDLKFVASPADGDSVLAVGAVNINGIVGAFSSWGPNAAGKIKPDVVSVGENAFYTLSTGVPAQASGTSLANPNLAGLVACLWQAFPEFSNMEISEVVRRSADRYNLPDNRYGYGIPDFRKAVELLNGMRSDRNAREIIGDAPIKAFPAPFRDQLTLIVKPMNGTATLQLTDIGGRLIRAEKISLLPDSYNYFKWTGLEPLSRGIYFLHFRNNEFNLSLKLIK